MFCDEYLSYYKNSKNDCMYYDVTIIKKKTHITI